MSKGLEIEEKLESPNNNDFIAVNVSEYKKIQKSLKALEILKAFDFEIEDYTEYEHGSIKVKCNRIILDDEEIDIAKEVLKNE